MSVPSTAIPLRSDRFVVVDPDTTAIRVLSPDGRVEVELDLSSEHPRLRAAGVDLEITATRTLSLQAEEVRIAGSRKVSLRSEGHLRIDAEAEVRVTGLMIHLN